MSFIDVYTGYNQIPIYEHCEEHTSFIMDCGLYYYKLCCYKAMPFSLKNVGATYKRLVNMMFKNLIRKAVEMYVDDILVKSKLAEDYIKHLGQMFDILRKYQMKLNP